MASPPQNTIPPLRNGDRLTRVEFERRYSAMSDKRKFELVDGVVYMASPVSNAHAVSHALLTHWLVSYALETPGTSAGSDATARLDEDNEPQPDVMLRVLPEVGGRTRTEQGYVTGPPELVAEVAYSSASYDLNQKKDVYRRHACSEYLAVDLHAMEVHWFRHRGGLYERLAADAAGMMRSIEFPGLWLDPRALLAADGRRMLDTLRLGLASAEHAAFVEKLGRR
jgi:Uma2 family endonuclease